MSVTSGFFPINSERQDILYDSEDLGRFFQGIYLNGVIAVIGDFFTCKPVDKDHISVGTGLAYFNGFFIKNDSNYILNIPSSAFPIPDKVTVQTDYPVDNPLDLGNLEVVFGLTYDYVLTGLELKESFQTDYPVDNPLDLGNLYVNAVYEQSEDQPTYDISIVPKDREVYGDCYIVLRLDYEDRLISISAIKISDYNEKTDLIIAMVTKTVDSITVKNLVGYSSGSKMVTGINQSTYFTTLINDIDSIYSIYYEKWKRDNENYYEQWQNNNIYCLSTTDQYNRLISELNDKSDKIKKEQVDVLKNETNKIVSFDNISSNSHIDVYSNPNNLAITGINVQGNNVDISFLPAYVKTKLYVEIY